MKRKLDLRQTLMCKFDVCRIDFYSDVLTPELLGDRRSRPASEKRIDHNSTCRGACEYARLDQIGWEGRKVRSFV